ncbi:MAG: M23 family metallopeptidase [Pseudomonadota bacterium]
MPPILRTRLTAASVLGMLAVFVGNALWLESSAALAGDRLVLSLPIACDVGQDCFVQSYVDLKDGPGVLDHRCGSATYDGHKGVDFRVRSAADAAKGVSVLAAAPGVVKGLRDGMRDRLIAPDGRDKSLVAGRECGNGVVIDHGGGWETQYCHLKRNSVVVRKGDKVSRGTVLGDVGYSGAAAFAHLHLSVRSNGRVIDPFSGKRVSKSLACPSGGQVIGDIGTDKTGLWEPGLSKQIRYTSGVVIDVGFAGGAPKKRDLEFLRSFPKPTLRSAALVFFARAINVRKGDRLALELTGPDGFSVSTRGEPMDRNRALWMTFAGKKLRKQSWTVGRYTGKATVYRNGDPISVQTLNLNLD